MSAADRQGQARNDQPKNLILRGLETTIDEAISIINSATPADDPSGFLLKVRGKLREARPKDWETGAVTTDLISMASKRSTQMNPSPRNEDARTHNGITDIERHLGLAPSTPSPGALTGDGKWHYEKERERQEAEFKQAQAAFDAEQKTLFAPVDGAMAEVPTPRTNKAAYNGHRYLLEEAHEMERELSRLKRTLETVQDILFRAPELNIGNYTDDQVADLNNAVIEAFLLLKSTPTAKETK